MIKHILFTITILVNMYCSSVAQSFTIKGTLKSSNEPVVGATIQIKDSQVGTVSDMNGYFELKIEKQEIIIEIRSIGYKIARKNITFEAGSMQEVEISMEENNLGLDEVVVTGTMNPTYITASPIKVEVVSIKHLETYIPTASSSIIEGIKLINGVQEVVACGVCFTNSISINGLPGAYTAILMDGTPIYGNLASVYGLNGIPSMIIDRFEVIKGPSSTLYGSEAVAGVINIITKDPAEQPFFSSDIMATSHLESFGNIAIAPKLKNADGYIGLNYAYINDFDDRNNDGFGDMANLDRYSLFTKWNIKRLDGKTFHIAAKYYYEDRRNGVEEFLEDRNYKKIRGNDSIYGESIYTSRLEVFGTYQLPLKENIKLDFSASHHDQDSYYGADHYVAQQKIAFGNLIWNKTIKRNNIVSGITTRLQYYDDNTIATLDSLENGDTQNNPDNQYIPGLFIQDEFEFSDYLTILAGGRLDYYSSHGLIFSPRLNIKSKIGDWSTFRINLGTGFKTVNLFAEDHAFITGQRTVEIAEKLNPEQSYNTSVNFNHVYYIGNSQGKIDLDAYYTYFTNKITPNYDEPGKIMYANTQGYAITKGVGFNVTHSFSFPLSFNIGANIQRATQTEPNENGEYVSEDLKFAPKWSTVAVANYNWKKPDIVFAYTLRFTGPMALPQVYDLDGNGYPKMESRPTISQTFSFHNLQITKTFSENWTIYGGVQNLLDYIQPYSPLVGYNDPISNTGFSNYFDTSYAYGPIHGREFYLGIKFSLN